MKKILNLLLSSALVIAAFCTISCEKKIEPGAGNEPEAEYYVVSLGLGGEIEVEYEPLARSKGDKDIYGFQVYSALDKDPVDEGGYSWIPYAYGLFDNIDNLTINLLKGYKYKFVATMVVDGKEKLSPSYNEQPQYGEPFVWENASSAGWTPLANTFNYSASAYLRGLGYGGTYTNAGWHYTHPNTDRYYGELEGYIPSSKGGKAKIHMKRTSFGAKFIANGKLAKNGTLEILIAGAPRMELNLAESNQISDTFTFSNVYEAWRDNQYRETIAININLHRTDGSTVPLGSHEIVYKRNATTVVKVNMENEGTQNPLGVEITETGEMAEDPETETTITDGEIVDTEIDTNK